MLSIIVAMSENRVIGRDGALPWHLPADLAHFKRLTTGHTIIMGRKTFESIGRVLPDRKHIIITRNPDYAVDGTIVVRSVNEALERACDAQAGVQEAFVIGGEEIFRAALPRAARIYLTLVHAEVEGDVFFPELDQREWALAEEHHRPADDRNEFALSFQRYDKQSA